MLRESLKIVAPLSLDSWIRLTSDRTPFGVKNSAKVRIKHRGGGIHKWGSDRRGCSKIHELSDRVRLSGVCSVKLALAHRIASDRATAAATVPRDEGLFWSIARTNRISGLASQAMTNPPLLISPAEPRERITHRILSILYAHFTPSRGNSSSKLGAYLFHYFPSRKVSE